MTSMSLSFPDPETELVFASRFSSTMTGVAWKMNLVMAIIWMLRLAIGYQKCSPQGAVGCSLVGVLCAMMSACHQCTAVLSYHRVGWGLHEAGKACYILCDLTACMIIVLLAKDHVGFPIVFSPVLVFALHGWAVPFAGCRLAVDVYLHALNLFVLLLLMTDQQLRTLPGVSCVTLFLSVIFALVLPGSANVLYEARCRAEFIRSRGEVNTLNSFWSKTARLSYFIYE